MHEFTPQAPERKKKAPSPIEGIREVARRSKGAETTATEQAVQERIQTLRNEFASPENTTPKQDPEAILADNELERTLTRKSPEQIMAEKEITRLGETYRKTLESFGDMMRRMPNMARPVMEGMQISLAAQKQKALEIYSGADLADPSILAVFNATEEEISSRDWTPLETEREKKKKPFWGGITEKWQDIREVLRRGVKTAAVAALGSLFFSPSENTMQHSHENRHPNTSEKKMAAHPKQTEEETARKITDSHFLKAYAERVQHEKLRYTDTLQTPSAPTAFKNTHNTTTQSSPRGTESFALAEKIAQVKNTEGNMTVEKESSVTFIDKKTPYYTPGDTKVDTIGKEFEVSAEEATDTTRLGEYAFGAPETGSPYVLDPIEIPTKAARVDPHGFEVIDPYVFIDKDNNLKLSKDLWENHLDTGLYEKLKENPKALAYYLETIENPKNFGPYLMTVWEGDNTGTEYVIDADGQKRAEFPTTREDDQSSEEKFFIKLDNSTKRPRLIVGGKNLSEQSRLTKAEEKVITSYFASQTPSSEGYFRGYSIEPVSDPIASAQAAKSVQGILDRIRAKNKVSFVVKKIEYMDPDKAGKYAFARTHVQQSRPWTKAAPLIPAGEAESDRVFDTKEKESAPQFDRVGGRQKRQAKGESRRIASTSRPKKARGKNS